jgi:transposase
LYRGSLHALLRADLEDDEHPSPTRTARGSRAERPTPEGRIQSADQHPTDHAEQQTHRAEVFEPHRARHRLSKLLLRQGIVYSGGHAWTGLHDRWLRQQRFDNPLTAMTFDSDYDAVLAVTARRARLDPAIAELAADSEFTPLAHRLGCLRGVATLTAFALAVEIGDWQRFTGNSIGSFVGLVPSEHSSGASRVQGPITKTGNTHARRLLIEAAWHHQPRYAPGKTMRDRWELAPPAARARGDAGNRRLHERWVTFNLHKKRAVIANVAIARELAGWCWSLAVMD